MLSNSGCLAFRIFRFAYSQAVAFACEISRTRLVRIYLKIIYRSQPSFIRRHRREAGAARGVSLMRQHISCAASCMRALHQGPGQLQGIFAPGVWCALITSL